MRVPNIKELIKGRCVLQRYEDGLLWYQISYSNADGDAALFNFPIPVNDDAAGGSFEVIEKPVTLMRWIREQIEYLNEAKRY